MSLANTYVSLSDGSGTVYFGSFSSVISSGTASGKPFFGGLMGVDLQQLVLLTHIPKAQQSKLLAVVH